MDTSKRLGVAFLWHMHQPFYKEILAGKYMMPWVRLHGVKDYYPMALLAENSDAAVTFNLVPSLVEQIQDYAENGATDTSLELTMKKASGLEVADKVELLNSFFKVNFKRFIEPSARYSQLLIKKGLKPLAGQALKKTLQAFSSRDFLDLQVLFNLSWFHSLSFDEDSNLRAIKDKGSSYAEDDKEYVISRQAEIMKRIIPLYRRLQEQGRIEITTTPFYHPILPLLCNTSIARTASPSMPLPKKRFSHPEDAEWHIEEAIRYHTSVFGRPPRGMWPSEGSVSEETLDLMIAKGIDWVATDEDILFRTLSGYDRQYKAADSFDRRIIYRPYNFRKDSRRISVIFRDKNLSDIISFNYNEWEPASAAWDLIGHFRRVVENLRRDTDRALLTIVMDGENAWEYYEDNGRKFFETLYSNLDNEPDICSTTVSGFLEIEPPKRTIRNIFPGSWIDHDFHIWIGEEQDNISWDYLSRVRSDLAKFTKSFKGPGGDLDASHIRRAWRELYIAEGSDWNWWYGGKAHTGKENPFGKLYRTHLKNIYKLLKKPIPDFLKVSIS